MSDRTCSIDECERPVSARGWCRSHYQRWYQHGDPLKGGPPRARPKPCAIESCQREARSRGYCSAHYDRVRRNGEPGEVAVRRRNPGAECAVDGCSRPVDARGYCAAHYVRWKKTGDPGSADIELRSKGADIGYGAAHSRVGRVKGKAASYACVACAGPAEQWAYDHADPNARRAPTDALLGAGMLYSADPDHYQPMCRPCHAAFDRAHAAN